MKWLILLACCALAPALTYAQSALHFRSTAHAGLADGEAGGAFLLQTIDGVSKGPWFLGGGAGLDYYRFRSAPLFLAASRDIRLNDKNALVLFLNGGTNLPVGLGGSPPFSNARLTFHGGEYFSGGVSWLLGMHGHRGSGILFSAGYEIKKLRESVNSTVVPCANGANCTPFVAYYEYLNRALFFMVGYRF
ncbi:MAG TPA: hypothetical protein VN616_04680 [Puia sp.]|nr:hypothetical protein [Puia sp.]